MPIKSHFIIRLLRAPRLHLLVAVLLISSFTVNNCFGQGWRWARTWDGMADDHGNVVTTDLSGNVYVCGTFDSYFLNSGGYNLYNYVYGKAPDAQWDNTYDIYLVKYDSAGNIQWARSYGDTLNEEPLGIACDRAGNVYIAGLFTSDSIQMGGMLLHNANGTAILGTETSDIFVAKISPDGAVVGAKRFGTICNEIASALMIDKSDHLFLAGAFECDSVAFDSVVLHNNGAGNMYVVRMDTNLTVMAARNFGRTAPAYANSMCSVANGNFILSGSFEADTIRFDSIALPNFFSAAANPKMFVVKLDSNLHGLWGDCAGSAGGAHGYGVSTDPMGNFVVTGTFSASAIQIDSVILHNYGSVGVFVAKYDSSGHFLWAKAPRGDNSNYSYTIACDTSGNTYIGGYFNSYYLVFGSDSLVNTWHNPPFLAQYDPVGNVNWARTSDNMGSGTFKSIHMSGTNNLYLTGDSYGEGIQLGPLLFPDPNSSTSDDFDMFLVKFNEQNLSSSDLKITNGIFICPNPTRGLLNVTLTEPGAYFLTVTDVLGRSVEKANIGAGIQLLQCDYSGLIDGTYILKLENSKQSFTTTFVVSH